MNRKKKLLLLGGSEQQIIAIKTAKSLGYDTVLCDYLPDNPGQYVADKFYLTSTTDKEAVLEVASKEGIDGVVAYASDPAAPTAAYVAEQLNLKGNPYQSVKILCNKDLFREFLMKNSFCTPRAYGYEVEKDVYTDAEKFRYPMIVKPVDSSGSKGITVLKSPENLKKAVEFAFSFSRCGRIVVEEYIEKKHPYLIGGDIFVVNGKVVLWGLLNCHRDNEVNPLVPVGKSYPLKLEENDIRNVKQMLSEMITKLNIQNGAMNVELVVDKKGFVYPIDIGPRSGGNMIPDFLEDIFRTDIVKMSIEAVMNDINIADANKPEGYYATHNLHSNQNGIYKNIIFSRELLRYIYRTCIYKKPGDIIECFDNASKCLGIIFMKFPNEEIMNEILEKINQLITVELL